MAHRSSDRARGRLRPVISGAVILAALLLGLAVAMPVGAVPVTAGYRPAGIAIGVASVVPSSVKRSTRAPPIAISPSSSITIGSR